MSHFSSTTSLTATRLNTALHVLYVEEAESAVADIVHHVGSKAWEVAHAQTPQDARLIATKQPVDVLIISASMPDIEPVALAEEITALHPKLAIFVLVPEGEPVSTYASGRIQLLPKSAPTEVIIAAVERMAKLVSWLTNNTTLELVSGLNTLPTIPSNYQGVIRAIHSPDSSVQDIADAVGKDIGITSRVLQIANSAFYGFSSKITSPMEASMLLGIDTLKSLVRYTHILNNFPQTPTTNAIFDAVWRHSSGVANIARKIVLLHLNDEQLAEEAFSAALLHDIGKVILTSLKQAEYKEVMLEASQSRSPIHLIERIRLKTTHAEAGAYLLSLWGIPYSILEAVAWHHFPSEAKEKTFSALTAVHVANVAEHRRHEVEGGKVAPPLDEAYLREVGVWDEAQQWVKLGPEKTRIEIAQKKYIPTAAAPVAKTMTIPWWTGPAIAVVIGVLLTIVMLRFIGK